LGYCFIIVAGDGDFPITMSDVYVEFLTKTTKVLILGTEERQYDLLLDGGDNGFSH